MSHCCHGDCSEHTGRVARRGELVGAAEAGAKVEEVRRHALVRLDDVIRVVIAHRHLDHERDRHRAARGADDGAKEKDDVRGPAGGLQDLVDEPLADLAGDEAEADAPGKNGER